VAARAQQDRAVVAIATVYCGRLTGARTVQAGRGQSSAAADQYRVAVTEPGAGTRTVRGAGAASDGEVVLEHWGGDAELLADRPGGLGPATARGPRERARVAARTVRYYDLDWLRAQYPDGTHLRATAAGVVLQGPRRARLLPGRMLLRAPLDDLLA
jgi:hypothetical protein